MGNGEFEGQSLESLHAMLAGSDPAKLANAGNALSDAAPKITEVGNYLRSHATRVEWRGEGADSFREWSHHFALEVMRLGGFTGAVGNHMVNAGQALTEAKAVVPKPVDAEKAHGDPDADKAHIADGTTKLQQAIHQMERLSSYYRAAKEDIAAEREPEFKELPLDGAVFDPEAPYGPEVDPAGQAPPGIVAVHRQPVLTADVSGRSEGSVAHGMRAGEHLGEPVEMSLDGMDKLSPPVRDSPPHLLAPVETSKLPEQGLPTTPARITPTPGLHTPNLPDQAGKAVPRVPSDGLVHQQRPATRAKNQRLSDAPGVSGGRPRNASGLPSSSRLPRGVVVGEGRAPSIRGAMPGSIPPAGGLPTSDNPAAGRRNYGPQAPGSIAPTTTGGPRGGVAGEERSGPARGPLPGAAGGMPVGSAGGMRGADAGRGRQGLATEPGGTAAARRMGSPRSAGFTPGGSGLVRGSGATPTAQSGAGQTPRPERGEEGEDWPLARDTVPPVVE